MEKGTTIPRQLQKKKGHRSVITVHTGLDLRASMGMYDDSSCS